MSIPGITQNLVSKSPPPNRNGVAGRLHVIGPGSAGAMETTTELRNLAQLAAFGFGPGPSLAGAILAGPDGPGGPVYFTRSATTTPGAAGSVIDAPIGPGVLKTIPGVIKLAGAATNGDLLFRATGTGYALIVQTGGALAAAVANGVITLTVPAATAATDVVTFYNGADAGATAARALATIEQQGNGAANAGTTLASTSFDNGGLLVTPLRAGASVRTVVSGNNTALSASLSTYALTINLATDADGTSTSTAADVITYLGSNIDLTGIMTVTAGGTGLGLAGKQDPAYSLVFGSTATMTVAGTPTDRYEVQIVCTTAGTVGGTPSPYIKWTVDAVVPIWTKVGNDTQAFEISPRRSGLSVVLSQRSGASKAITHTLIAGVLTIYLGTSAGSVANSTGSAVVTYLQAQADVTAAFDVRLVGTGAGVMVAQGPLYLADPALTYSNVVAVPSSGEVALSDGALNTGLTVTLSGVFAVGDVLLVNTTAPKSSISAQVAALTAAAAHQTYLGGAVVFADPVTRADVPQDIAVLVATWQTRFLWGLHNARLQGDGVANETQSAHTSALTLEWSGFTSRYIGVCARECIVSDAYTRRKMRRPAVFAIAPRAAACPYHQDLGQVVAAGTPTAWSGPLLAVLHLYGDEAVDTGLHDQRFITLRTHVDNPGAFYVTGSPSMADPVSDAGYARIPFVREAFAVGRRVREYLFPLLLRRFAYISAPEQDTGAPAGALTEAAAAFVAGEGERAVRDEIFTQKIDGEASAPPFTNGEPYCSALRNYSFSSTKELRVEWQFPAPVSAENITIQGASVIAA